MPGRTLGAQGSRRGARLRRRRGAPAPAPQCPAPRPPRARATRSPARCSTRPSRRAVEALGARSMAGVRDNLAALTELRLRTDPLTRARNRDEVPLASAIGLMVRERLTGEAPAEAAASAGLELVSDWIEERAGGDLDALGLALDDQAAFAALVGKLLRDLELVEGEPEAPDDPDEGDEAKATTRPRAARMARTSPTRARGRGEAEIRGEQEEGGEEADSDWSDEDHVGRVGRARRGWRGGHDAGPPEPAAFRSPAAVRLSHLHHPI